MRLCRFEHQGSVHLGFYADDSVISLSEAAKLMQIEIPLADSLLRFLPGGSSRVLAQQIQRRIESLSPADAQRLRLPLSEVKLLVPHATPSKLLLLAGNYAKHIEEGGARAAERAQTFPYIFMKPPLTTLTHPGDPIRLPAVSPDFIDWELELGVVIGRQCRAVKEAPGSSRSCRPDRRTRWPWIGGGPMSSIKIKIRLPDGEPGCLRMAAEAQDQSRFALGDEIERVAQVKTRNRAARAAQLI